MTTYIYTATANANISANIATNKVRLATTANSIVYAVGFPETSGLGTITTAANSNVVVGNGTAFYTSFTPGTWIGDETGNAVGIIKSIANNTSMTLTANALVELSDGNYIYNPYGVPPVDSVLDTNSCPTASGIVPANVVLNNVYVGQGNVVSFKAVSGNCTFSITELGAPTANTGTTGY